ncbi:MAG TPA: glycosyltransferase [Xanthobacteraceae bacterium]|jgi:glycosyltransferase involved in cell wall biosynthesis
MSRIIIADTSMPYDGRDLDVRPLGGTESSVIRCARELVCRGHEVSVYTNCEGPIEHEGVAWRPLSHAAPESCDLYVAVQQPKLLGFVRKPQRRAIWVLWPSNQLKHYKKIWRMWLYRPIPILASQYQVVRYSHLLPHQASKIVIPLALPDDVRGREFRATVPRRRAIFASNPQRNLRRLVEIWAASILPRVPDAVLDVFGVNSLRPGEEAWKAWEGSVLPPGMPENVKRSVVVHPSLERRELIEAMRNSRVMLYLGHKCEAFCLSLAEAQALGVPAVIAPVAVLPERVIDGVTGFHRSDAGQFAEAAVSLLTDDRLWRRQHEAAIQNQQGISWPEYARRFELALFGGGTCVADRLGGASEPAAAASA